MRCCWLTSPTHTCAVSRLLNWRYRSVATGFHYVTVMIAAWLGASMHKTLVKQKGSLMLTSWQATL